MDQTNCKNCGAPLKHNNSRITKCEYCGTEYHQDIYGRLEEYYVTLEIFGKKRRFYMNNIEVEYLSDSFRTLDGELHQVRTGEEIRMELISCGFVD